jgi:hypothetical protein
MITTATTQQILMQIRTVFVPIEKLEEQCNDANAIVVARLYHLYLAKRDAATARSDG